MLGYCPECQTLRRIRPVRMRFGERACIYRAIEHEVIQHSCGGIGAYDFIDAEHVVVCRKCGPRSEREFRVVACEGSKRDI